jgi:hypothetical protein
VILGVALASETTLESKVEAKVETAVEATVAATAAFEATTEAAAETETDVVRNVMRRAPFSFQRDDRRLLNSNLNFKREVPQYTNPALRSNERAEVKIAVRKGDELIPLKERNAKKAVRNPVMAKTPEYKVLFKGSKYYEPIDPTNKKFKSPVFLVDPKFTKKLDKKEKVAFEDNDFGGHEVPVNPTRWPYVDDIVQTRFKVGPDCAATGEAPLKASELKWIRLQIGDKYAPAWEPFAVDARATKTIAKQNQHDCYRGEDFGGNNIPFPHPAPPKPSNYYDDAFVDLMAEMRAMMKEGMESMPDIEDFNFEEKVKEFRSASPKIAIADDNKLESISALLKPAAKVTVKPATVSKVVKTVAKPVARPYVAKTVTRSYVKPIVKKSVVVDKFDD